MSRRGASEWLAVVGVLLLVAVGAATAASGGFHHSSSRTARTARSISPSRVGKLVISNVRVTRTASSAVVRWRTNVPARSYLAFRLGSLGLAASTRSRNGVSHVGVLRDLKRGTIYHLWIVATKKTHTIRRAAIVALPGR